MDASYKHPVVAVVGPTATGKTALGVALAEQFGGEVISADSMQIYKGLDVGTAKVTPEETHGIPHHGVDILEPDAPFSVADFTAMAGRLEQEIAGRGHLPILVGGTGLYVQSFLYGVRFTEEKAPAGLREQLAEELAQKGGAALYAELQQVDPECAAKLHPNNHGRVLRALELYEQTGETMSCRLARSRPAQQLSFINDFHAKAFRFHQLAARILSGNHHRGFLGYTAGYFATKGFDQFFRFIPFHGRQRAGQHKGHARKTLILCLRRLVLHGHTACL